MKTNIKATNITITPAIAEYIDRKLGMLEKYFSNPDTLINIEVGKVSRHHKSGDVFKAEIKINSNGKDYYVVSETEDLYAAIDEAKDDMVQELASESKKSRDLFRKGGGACPVTSVTGDGNMIVEGKLGIGSLSAAPTTKLQIAGGSAFVEESALTDVATITVDWQLGNQQRVTLGGNRAIAFSNQVAGQVLRLMICQDGTGSRTVTAWPASVQWNGGTAPTLTTTANKCDVVSFLGTNATGTLKVFGTATLNF
jgi:ribosomal subunit interface protein